MTLDITIWRSHDVLPSFRDYSNFEEKKQQIRGKTQTKLF